MALGGRRVSASSAGEEGRVVEGCVLRLTLLDVDVWWKGWRLCDHAFTSEALVAKSSILKRQRSIGKKWLGK